MDLINKFSNIITGKPLANEQAAGEKYNVPFGLAIMASDAISSVAYAAEEILMVLIATLGLVSYKWLGFTSIGIIILLAIITISYLQIIRAYPQGGGAYIVAKENIGINAGLIAGAALLVDYLLTVAVSASAGVAAIVSAFPQFTDYKVLMVVILIIVLTILNLRGVGESSKIFAIPTYIFIFSMIFMIGYGIIKYTIDPSSISVVSESSQLQQMGNISILLLLKAFSQGCSALSGIEAVSNSVPNFKEPSQRNAKIVMILLSVCILILFGGSAILAGICKVVPNENMTVLAQIANSLFGKSFMFYLIQISTAIILLMACNTAFTGFPMLMYIVAKDGYVPRQFSIRGKRLSFSIGIIALSCVAGLLGILFKANVNGLIPLYSVGVFLSFTLAQFGMVIHWKNSKENGWKTRASINAFGSIVTLITTGIIAYEKFTEGAWLVIIIIPILVFGMKAIKKHYNLVASKLKISKEDYDLIEIGKKYHHIIVVPIATLNKASLNALEYSKSISDNVIALNVSSNKDQIEQLKQKWSQINNNAINDILLITKYSPFRQTIGPLIQDIKKISDATDKNEKLTVVIPQFITHKWWGNILHNHTGFFIRESLLKYDNIVVSTIPFHVSE